METKVDAPIAVLMLGLDGAGKTTLLYTLKQGGEGGIKTIPTIGFNVEPVTFEDKIYTFWDIGGRDTVRVLWKFYAENKAAVVFVLDASNSARLEEAKDFLHTIMAHETLHNAPLLIVANKHDQENCATNDELQRKLNLTCLKQPMPIVHASAFDQQSLNTIMMELKKF